MKKKFYRARTAPLRSEILESATDIYVLRDPMQVHEPA